MHRCLISLGANLGDPQKTISAAAALLQQRLHIVSQAFHLSRLFRTPPVGGPSGQPPFVNAVLAIKTQLSSHEVWQAIRDVEHELGRHRDRRWEARRIDLDILLYEQQRIWTPHLKIPHPRMCMRRFILLPALDVAADWVDPVTQQTLRELSQPLQTGPGSLWLVSKDRTVAQAWLDEVAELAAAQVCPADEATSAGGSRWMSPLSVAEFEHALEHGSQLPPKLTVFLAEPSSAPQTPEETPAWETQHLVLAERLRLSDPQVQSPLQSATHPREAIETSAGGTAKLETWRAARYLLPADDRPWAIHEMLSALEAMDCPIEAI